MARNIKAISRENFSSLCAGTGKIIIKLRLYKLLLAEQVSKLFEWLDAFIEQASKSMFLTNG